MDEDNEDEHKGGDDDTNIMSMMGLTMLIIRKRRCLSDLKKLIHEDRAEDEAVIEDGMVQIKRIC